MQKFFFGALCASALTLSAAAGFAETKQDGAMDMSKDGAMEMAQDDGMKMHQDEVQLGDLTLSGAFSRATLPNAPVAGGFLNIANNGAEDDRLVAVRAGAITDRAEVHEMSMEGDVMKMRQLPEGLPLPAGAAVELKPGGYHIMFLELKAPLVEGETVDVTLVFEKAGEVELPFAIGPRNARKMDDTGHGEGGDHGGQ